MTHRDWPSAERPRERLVAYGAKALSEAELLAIFLRTGDAGRSAVDVARDVLWRISAASRRFSPRRWRIRRVRGLGDALAQLQAMRELGRRALGEELAERNALNSPRAVQEYLRIAVSGLPNEVFHALFLDAQHRLIASEELFRGTLTQTSVYPRTR